jgi:predicted nucleotidyltransferase
MRSPPELQDHTIVDHLRREIAAVIAIYRFGSTAQGISSTSSDIDIAVLAEARLTPERRFEVQEALAAKLGHDVDLVDLAAASTVMAMQVIARGKLLYESDASARGRFEDYTFGAYARLNEERRGILDRVAAEGTVYGR